MTKFLFLLLLGFVIIITFIGWLGITNIKIHEMELKE